MVGKIATICFPFSGDDIGGSHISALGLIKALDPDRFRPVVLVQENGRVFELFRSAGIWSDIAPASPALRHGEPLGPSSLLALSRTARAFSGFLRNRGVDIVHTNDGRTHAAWAVPAKLSGACLVWHHRGSPDALGRRFLAPLIADHLISVSDFAAHPRKFAFRTRRNTVIHSPFDTDVDEDRDAARAALAQELGCTPETRLIGFFGALTARKRPLLFIDAIARLRDQEPHLPVKAVVFGEPFDISNAMITDHARRLGIAESVHMMGFRSPGSRWLAACDVLMVPAIDEPFGRTLIEAMLVGTPVIATRSGGNVEVLRDGVTGLLVLQEDPDALADATSRLFADPWLKARIEKEAREDARSRFGIQRHAQAVMNIYEDLLRRKSSTRRDLSAQQTKSIPDFGNVEPT